MRITLIDAGKRFNRDWIFRRLHYEFIEGRTYAITGSNGSGKSTLLQAIGGAIGISEGKLRYAVAGPQREMSGLPGDNAAAEDARSGAAGGSAGDNAAGPDSNNGTEIPADEVFKYMAIAAPYLELIEEMTVTEFLHFHQAFKPFLPACSIAEIISLVGLAKAAHKQIRYYSSGMKQRVKLAQAIFSDTPVLLLDEPCTNLDAEGVALYQQLIRDHTAGRLVVVSSNDEQEYAFCENILRIADWK
jgi:ABC-type multidrug transport system ATPase subunit